MTFALVKTAPVSFGSPSLIVDLVLISAKLILIITLFSWELVCYPYLQNYLIIKMQTEEFNKRNSVKLLLKIIQKRFYKNSLKKEETIRMSELNNTQDDNNNFIIDLSKNDHFLKYSNMESKQITIKITVSETDSSSKSETNIHADYSKNKLVDKKPSTNLKTSKSKRTECSQSNLDLRNAINFINNENLTRKLEELQNSPDIKTNEESLLIHDLVLNKFDDILNNHSQRSLKRKLSKSKQIFSEYEESIKSPSLGSSHLIDEESCYANSNHENDLYSIPTDIFNRTQSDVEYDEEQFLKEALGDDQLSKAELDVSRNSTRSITTTNLSTLLSSQWSSTCSTLKNITQRTTSSTLPVKATDLNLNEYTECYVQNSKLDEITEDFAKLNQTILQLSKCLDLCSAKKENWGSAAHIEAERILLVAVLKKEVLQRELTKSEYTEIKDFKNFGTLSLRNIKFLIKNNSIDMENTTHFVCIARCDNKIIPSRAIQLRLADKHLEFNDDFYFTQLLPDFEIHLAIYALKLRNQPTMNNKSCLKLKFQRNLNRVLNTGNIRSSSFKLIGQSRIRANHVKNTTFRLFITPPSDIIDEEFTTIVDSSVHFNTAHKGFLTIGSNNCTVWNRRWCILDGYIIKYWNYPSESENVAPPVGTIDLQYCLTHEIRLADRSLCSRPRTLTILVQQTGKLMQFYLSADTLEELKLWDAMLNTTVNSLWSWNCMKC